MGKLVEAYFTNIFSSSNPTGFDEVLAGMLPTVTSEMKMSLDRQFIDDEVFKALNQMAPLTTPGPNGTSPIFYKTFWHIVGFDVTNVVLTALNSGHVPEDLTRLS